MDIHQIWDKCWPFIWHALNTPVAVAFVAGIVLWALNHLYAKKPLWQRFEGSLIAAVKFAEKEIPDNVSNKSIARMDAALKYAITVYEAATKKRANDKVKAELREGIELTHHRLEVNGTLKK